MGSPGEGSIPIPGRSTPGLLAGVWRGRSVRRRTKVISGLAVAGAAAGLATAVAFKVPPTGRS